jgi:hypothetical protein
MNKYLYAVDEDGTCYIDHISATDVDDAKDRIMRKYIEAHSDWDCTDNWDDFINCAWEHYYAFSEPEDIINYT